nr:hypothetical protein [uncultured Pseudodesulfovibrio sp.]
MRILIIPMILLISFIIYLAFSNPNMIVVSENLKLNDISNQTREAIQGKNFWKHQLNEVKRLKMQLKENLALNKRQREEHIQLLKRIQSREEDNSFKSLTSDQKETLWATKEANMIREIKDINRQYEHSKQIVTDDFPELNKLMEKIEGHIKTLN